MDDAPATADDGTGGSPGPPAGASTTSQPATPGSSRTAEEQEQARRREALAQAPKEKVAFDQTLKDVEGCFTTLVAALQKLQQSCADDADEAMLYFLLREEVQDIRRQFLTHVALIYRVIS